MQKHKKNLQKRQQYTLLQFCENFPRFELKVEKPRIAAVISGFATVIFNFFFMICLHAIPVPPATCCFQPLPRSHRRLLAVLFLHSAPGVGTRNYRIWTCQCWRKKSNFVCVSVHGEGMWINRLWQNSHLFSPISVFVAHACLLLLL